MNSNCHPAGGRAWSEARRPRPASAWCTHRGLHPHGGCVPGPDAGGGVRRAGWAPSLQHAGQAPGLAQQLTEPAGGADPKSEKQSNSLWPRKSSGRSRTRCSPSSSSSDVSASSSMSSASMPPRACAGGCSGGAGAPGAGCGPEGPPGAPGAWWRVLGTASPRAAGARCRPPAVAQPGRAGRWETARRPRTPRSPVEAAAGPAEPPAAVTRCPGLGSSTAAASGAREGRGRARRAAASAPGCSPRQASGGQP